MGNIFSKVAEQRMTTLAKELFYPWESPSVNEVVKTVEHFKPGYVSKVMTYLSVEGYDHINQVPISLLVDSLLGLDCVFSLILKSGDKINIGVDVTVDPYIVDSKIRKLNDFKPQLKAVGIYYCLVINWKVEKLSKEWTEQDKKSMRKQITNSIFSSKDWVKSLELIL